MVFAVKKGMYLKIKNVVYLCYELKILQYEIEH